METVRVNWKGYSDHVWLSFHFPFRSKTYQFDDFLTTWTEKLKSGGPDVEHTIMTVRISKDIDKFKVNRSIFLNYSAMTRGVS